MAATLPEHRRIATYEIPIGFFENTMVGTGGQTITSWRWEPPYFWATLPPEVTVQGPVTVTRVHESRVPVSFVLAQIPNPPPEGELSWTFSANTVFAQRVRENLDA